MQDRKNNLMILLAALVLSAFFMPQTARAEIILPTSGCESQQENFTIFGVNQHLTTGETREDGTRAFTYGSDNAHFVSTAGNKILFNIKLLFTPDNPNATIKLVAFDSHCDPVFGFGPVLFTLNALAENIVSFDQDTQDVELNGEVRTSRVSGIIRYIWAEVWDGHPASNPASFSYLVDVTNLQNPTVTAAAPPPPTEPTGKRPVLIIPGIMGSELKENDELIWPNVSKLLLSPSDKFLTESLELDSQGNSVKKIESTNIVKKVLGTDSFENLENTLVNNSYILDQNFFLLPYDWRLNLDTSIDALKNKIDAIKTQTGFFKVDIVAHSMGGLLTEDYVKQYGNGNINKLIFVGTPHLGAPKAGKVLLEGDLDFPINVGINPDAIKKISQNSSSIYQLLPNSKYFEIFQGYLKPMPNTEGVLDYQKTKEFLSDLGKNKLLLSQAQSFFDKQLYNLDFGRTEVYNITGCKIGTQAFYNLDRNNGNILNVKYTSGDGTVPLVSADYISGTKYYVKSVKHSSLPSSTGVRDLILKLLDGQTHEAANISTSNSFCNFKGKSLSWHSPVDVHIYDSLGNHTGPVNGDIENNIPGVEYQIINSEIFIFLPTDEGQEYNIQGTGTGSGTFDLIVSNVDNGEITSSNLFDNVDIILNSGIEFSVSSSSTDNVISVDFANTGSGIPVDLTNLFPNEEQALVQADAPAGGGGSAPVPAPEIVPPPVEPVVMEKPAEIPVEPKILGKTLEKKISDGMLVLDVTDGITVYMIGSGGKKYGFTSDMAFLGQGFNFAMIIEADLTGYELGGLITDPNEAHPNGSLVFDGQTVWLINNEERYAFANLEELRLAGFDFTQAVPINKLDLELRINN